MCEKAIMVLRSQVIVKTKPSLKHPAHIVGHVGFHPPAGDFAAVVLTVLGNCRVWKIYTLILTAASPFDEPSCV